jgi:hypothetical protein
VPDVTYINSDVLPEPAWASRLGASSPRAITFPGATVPAVGRGTGPSTVVVPAVARFRGTVTFVDASPQNDAVATLLGQTDNHNYMTSVTAVGEGASGPTQRPRDRKPV